ncbi:SNF2 family N-terminal domain-containing protein [Phellopilus nigrolimitatus]|nr:SNF2 family N-terminal domain-containing protein [Phellopilus nigrolimitatus]
MATHSPTPSTSSAARFYAQPLASYSRTSPIDLTLDDDPHEQPRQIKRPRLNSDSDQLSLSNSSTPSISTPPPSMSHSHLAPPKLPADFAIHSTPTVYPLQSLQSHGAYRPHFTGPSNSSAFFPNRNVQTAYARSPSMTGPDPDLTNVPQQPQQQQPRQQQLQRQQSQQQQAQQQQSQQQQAQQQQALLQPPMRQIIDLTSSPSPPPPTLHTPQLPQEAQRQLTPGTLDVPPKTPVCIGQLTVTALVLYPVSYLQPQGAITGHANEAADWASVRLQHDSTIKQRNPNADETIHIKTPPTRIATGETLAGENFGVVEQKVATVLGPMLGKGLIRLDAKVRRGVPNLPILPLQLLVHTPNGNIPIVSRYLQQSGLLLDHPSSVWDPTRLVHFLYLNPHNPPPGGHARNFVGSSRIGYPGSGNNKWNTPAVSGKSVEVQRSQVDEVFKSLRDGDELEETEPSPDIATKLYPHQKKALTFLLEREKEIAGPDGKNSSLWQLRASHHTHAKSWINLVTSKEVGTEPEECKGALLADDMGLGKTITCVSLIAATLPTAQKFAQLPLPPPPKPPLEQRNSAASLSASHFAGSVWGMPDISTANESMSLKKKAQVQKEQDKWELEYARARRLKVKSRATLIVCPLSTVVNWEDQFKEHWAGDVQVIGGAGSIGTSSQTTLAQIAPGLTCGGPPLHRQTMNGGEIKSRRGGDDVSSTLALITAADSKPKRGTPLKVYIYHGNARRPEPNFLADFDAVITTYATLASEFSKQTRSIAAQDADEDDGDESGDGSNDNSGMELDESGNQIIKIPKAKEKKGIKRKKNTALFSGVVEMSSALQSIHWFRVVLDEAHSIKETSTVASRASCDLEADRRLCLTGTPVQNKLDDVYALIKFLRLNPFEDKTVWQEFIGVPVKFGQPLGVARLQTIMKCITLRRTKETKAQNGQAILSLPPRRDELRLLKFDEQEQRIYDEFFQESRDEFKELSHKNEVMKNYVGILQKILRLRQICDHYELVNGKGPSDSEINYEEIIDTIAREGINVARASAIFSLIRDTGTAQCVECGCELGSPIDLAQKDAASIDLDAPVPNKRGRKSKAPSRAPTRQSSPTVYRPILSRCQHLFCIACFQNSVFVQWPNIPEDTVRACSACHTALRPNDAVEVSPDCTAGEPSVKKKSAKKEKRQKGVNLDNFHPSTKVKALLGDLVTFSRANPYSANYDPSSIEIQMVDEKGNEIDDNIVKTVVFSQWTTMLDKIEDALEAAGIRYDRLDGTMKRDDRTRAMDALKHDPGCEVLLVSLKAGGVGLNLTAAQRVYLMDPYWNPAVENQAVDRIHRLGQTRPVTTIKLIIENTIEARLLEVQRKKTELANMTLGQHLSKAEVLQRRMEELNQLFHE